MSEDLYGKDLFGQPVQPESRGAVADRFTVAPFSVLNAREGFWQDRKRAWLAYGIESEVGRSAKTYGALHELAERVDGKARAKGDGTSIFDPVVCELAYRWFCPPAGVVLDPFAGGSVRGVVAGILGLRYWGCDLRKEQVDANVDQSQRIFGPGEPWEKLERGVVPHWHCGDSSVDLVNGPDRADLVFSCPPYGDLEVYSDDPRDISGYEYDEFRAAYWQIIEAACARLADNRFAVWVVGDFRDPKTGLYRDFVSDTIFAFREAGLGLYNEAILITSAGSLPLRITRQFNGGRKLGKSHQQVLVFAKGDPKAAAKAAMWPEEGQA